MLDIEQEIHAIHTIKSMMKSELGTLLDERAALEAKIRDIMDPHIIAIQEHEDNIRNLTLVAMKSYKGDDGSKITYRKESVRTSWDTKALEGYAAGGHDEILQFKKETMVAPGVVIKIAEVE